MPRRQTFRVDLSVNMKGKISGNSDLKRDVILGYTLISLKMRRQTFHVDLSVNMKEKISGNGVILKEM